MTFNMKNAIAASILVAGSAAIVLPIPASANPMVGGAAMSAQKNIVENAVNSKDHTTLVAAVKAGGLVDTLEGKGPFTVFAPTNEAFAALPAGTVDTLLKPDNKAKLDSVLTYHVLPGKMTTAALREKIKDGHGKAMLKTVEGSDLIAEEHDGKIELLGAKGSKATITIANVEQSNGVIQVVDGVLLP
jgi:uncharacterized surface protein with fasciclin (FAS1) repeats